MSESARIKSPTLIRALKDHGGSNRELAEEANISFRAIAEARNGFDQTEIQGARKRLGAVSSITRLAIHLNLEPGVVLSEVGIDPSDAAVQRQIERARETSTPKTHHQEDYVLQAVKARELADPKRRPGPIVGIVPWSPFSDVDQGGASVARLLARSVLGSLNPEWDREVNVVSEESFGDAEKRLLSDDAGTPECLLGLYDLPWRRRGDVEVVALPGLYVRVGGICTQSISWKEILTGWNQTLPHALVIEGDVGDKLLSGPVDYPDARIIKPRLKTQNPREIADRVKYEVTHRLQPDGVLLVADGPLVSDVQSVLAGMDITICEVTEPEWAPVCRFGFAIRIDARRFKELVEEAISQDLLGRVFPRTVYLYLKLLKSNNTGQVRLNLAEMASQFHPDGPLKFLKIAQEFDPHWRTFLSNAVMDKPAFDDLADKICGSAPSGRR
ncbi:MAG: hypothetical protein C0504_00220 [Candidatus Solibacter sp.]|nr:hypothetical protein [Candidatus Solibacter sp.]